MMACRIDFHEVLIDSPNFRWNEIFLLSFRSKICQKWKLCKIFNIRQQIVSDFIKCLLCFRFKLEEQEQDIENLEQKLEKILKLATQSCDSGRQFVVNQRWVTFPYQLWVFPDTTSSSIHSALSLASQSMNHLFNWIRLWWCFLLLLLALLFPSLHQTMMNWAIE